MLADLTAAAALVATLAALVEALSGTATAAAIARRIVP